VHPGPHHRPSRRSTGTARRATFPELHPPRAGRGNAGRVHLSAAQRRPPTGRALDLYRDTPGSLSPQALATSQTLADVATAYLINARAREELKDSPERSRKRPCTIP